MNVIKLNLRKGVCNNIKLFEDWVHFENGVCIIFQT